MKVLVAVGCLLLAIVTEGGNPGLRARITSKGFDYANTVAIEALKAGVEQIKIPDQGGKSGKLQYSVSNIRVTQFSPPQSSLKTTVGKGLTWTGSGAGIALAGDFHYKALFISGGGSFSAGVKDVSFGLTIELGEDTNGRPTISSQPSECSANIGDVDFKFHGDASWLLNIFRNEVAKKIKEELNKQMCSIIDVQIKYGATKLKDLPVSMELGKTFLLDYSLTKNPNVTSTYMETCHKGEVYWQTDSSTEAPLPVPTLGEYGDTSRMLYLWVSDYVFNSMMYVAQKHDFLKDNITAQDLPAESRGVLDTTCSGFIPKCVGSLIPEIGDKYPNSKVEMRITSTTQPKLIVTSAGASVTGAATIDLYANIPGHKDTPFLVTLYAKMSTMVDISLKNELLYASVKDLSINLKAGKSAVGTIHDEFLSFLIKEALNVYFIPKLNGIGQKGFPLPLTKDVKFVDSELSLTQDTIMVATDLQYTPSYPTTVDNTPDDDTLRFIPHKAVSAKHLTLHSEQ